MREIIHYCWAIMSLLLMIEIVIMTMNKDIIHTVVGLYEGSRYDDCTDDLSHLFLTFACL